MLASWYEILLQDFERAYSKLGDISIDSEYIIPGKGLQHSAIVK